MKYLEDPRFAHFTNVLSDLELGDVVLDGRIEAFSCKRAGDDKRLSKMLEQQLKEEFASSPGGSPDHSSSLGPLSESSTRNLLIDLIITMNASFPDYDFSSLRPDQFTKELRLEKIVNDINTHLANVDEFRIGGTDAAGEKRFLVEVWKAVEDLIRLRDCEVYQYIPDLEGDPFSEGTLWSFNYFFFNKTLKRIVFFTCIARSKLFTSAEGTAEDDSDLPDDVDETDMDGAEDDWDLMGRPDWEDGK
mmetsp:Transcript_1530/g.4163  ORF Transcript_1530/g.4163 Transcript_1530/m.4163 type:complete len:247 (-) Transcript_1530:579-1319(-)|eukprot:CAMPEP_0118861484 /NCGR_PEP_ID=MMETSP1163-20130328/6992_1 /TAXON_ID=124430 /ORGANISM="Phaeomonas parva, Strain CCMP2877" /LENGTH=246 /DNA_ID=CAMNT_0006795301 /DNA_START=494 /DNA_END=1234 /DNA_ORIENTATION=+